MEQQALQCNEEDTVITREGGDPAATAISLSLGSKRVLRVAKYCFAKVRQEGVRHDSVRGRDFKARDVVLGTTAHPNLATVVVPVVDAVGNAHHPHICVRPPRLLCGIMSGMRDKVLCRKLE